jgi:hypothetical protein
MLQQSNSPRNTLEALDARMTSYQRAAEELPVGSSQSKYFWQCYQALADDYDALKASQAVVDATRPALPFNLQS